MADLLHTASVSAHSSAKIKKKKKDPPPKQYTFMCIYKYIYTWRLYVSRLCQKVRYRFARNLIVQKTLKVCCKYIIYDPCILSRILEIVHIWGIAPVRVRHVIKCWTIYDIVMYIQFSITTIVSFL